MARSPSSRQRSGLRGVNRLRRTLRRVEPELRKELRDDVDDIAQRILGGQQQMAPRRFGTLQTLLDYRIGRDGMTARVGYVTPAKQRDAWYALFFVTGTKGSPARNIPPLPQNDFIGKPFEMNRDQFVRRAQESMRQTLQKITSEPRRAND